MTLYLEDFKPGDTFQFGSHTFTRDEIITFGQQYDPQPFHVDEAAALLVSELVTNAVRHAKGIDVVTVNLHAGRTWLRIEVQDTDRHWPQPRIPGRHDESGFGFILVDALASTWGVRETEAGKAVWAELDTRPAG